MIYQWIGERQLHLAILQSLNLENNFNTNMFPKFSIAPCVKERLAEYSFPFHDVVFNEYYIQNRVSSFTHTFFHELAHSTSKYTNRWERIWANSSATQVNDIVGLEEQIAEIVAYIWRDVYDRQFNINGQTKAEELKAFRKVFVNNKTTFPLPWKEIELAAFSLLKNKTCPQILIALKYYKKLIKDNKLTILKEGIFNG